MSDSSEPVKVRLYVATGFVGGTHEDTITIDREEWDEMSPAERFAMLNEESNTFLHNHIEAGWTILSGADESEVD